jgi:protein involved in polysaccharide export with SLBB domain
MQMKKHGNIIFKSIFITALSLILPAIILAMLTLGSAQEAFAQQAKETEQVYEKDKEPLPAFGYNIFRELPEPITEGPMDEQYLLSPGDEVIITVWGQLNLKYPLIVNDDGFIEIPDEGGRVFTNGVSLKELKRLVTERLSRIYSSYINSANPSANTAFVDVKLGKVRKLLVYVVGEVKNQGAYTISSGVPTLLNVLNNAGGVKETGSLREIKVRRANGTIDAVDLYEFLITGKMDIKKRSHPHKKV